MLSAKRSKAYQEQLRIVGSQASLIRRANANHESKIKQKGYIDAFGLIGFSEEKAISDLKWKTNAITFLMVISEFEAILFKICDSYNKNLVGEIRKNFDQDKFLEIFVRFKVSDDFIPFAFTKGIYEKVSKVDLEYLTDLIRVRNYFAHGEKTDSLLEKTDPNIIHDIDTIVNQLCLLIETIES